MLDTKTKKRKWRVITESLAQHESVRLSGYVQSIEGTSLVANNITPKIGSICIVGKSEQLAEVVSVDDKRAILYPYDNIGDISIGDKVTLRSGQENPVGSVLLGRVVDAFGRSIDGKGVISYQTTEQIQSKTPSVLERPLITEQLVTGVRVLDSFIPLGKGQRIGIFSGSGVGKTSLLGMLIHNSMADVNVICLVGERGREVKELVHYTLNEEDMEHTIIVNASSDDSAVQRTRAALYAMSIAEYFRDQGNDVSFYVDSVTRLAHAQREIGLLRGEMPASRGYPSSLYPLLSNLFERCSTSSTGSITGLFTILVEGDDMDEPVSDIVRGMIDGHIVLSRELAEQNHYPAIQVSRSLSRVAPALLDKEFLAAANKVRTFLASYEQSKDVIQAGVYAPGSNEMVDIFLSEQASYNAFVQQSTDEHVEFSDTRSQLISLAKRL